jgi:hypothetical protein
MQIKTYKNVCAHAKNKGELIILLSLSVRTHLLNFDFFKSKL